MDLRPYIRGTLWTGALLIVALAISGSLSLILGSAGDHGGSDGARGVALVAIIGLILDVLTLLVLLALTALSHHPDDRHGSSNV